MAVVINATPKSPTANSYVTLAEGEAYMAERLNVEAWTGSDDKKKQALITASYRIDQEQFEGYKTTTAQQLKWPREGATDEDGEEYDPDTIPTIIKWATFEEALALLNRGNNDLLHDSGLEEYKRVKVGELEIERNLSFSAGQLGENVKRILRPVLATASNSSVVFLG